MDYFANLLFFMFCLLSKSSWLIVCLYIYYLNWFVSMERLQDEHIRCLFNDLFSCRSKVLRFKHHITLLSRYRICNSYPKGFSLKFHCGTVDPYMQRSVSSTLKKCSMKLRNLFEQYYKSKLSEVQREEENIILSLKLFHLEQAHSIMEQLKQRTKRMEEVYEVMRVKKYDRDGLKPKKVNNPNIAMRSESAVRKYEPVNLTNRSIEDDLLSLCSKGPSFVPTLSGLIGMTYKGVGLILNGR